MTEIVLSLLHCRGAIIIDACCRCCCSLMARSERARVYKRTEKEEAPRSRPRSRAAAPEPLQVHAISSFLYREKEREREEGEKEATGLLRVREFFPLPPTTRENGAFGRAMGADKGITVLG